MATGEFGRRKARIVGVFLLALTLINAVKVYELIPFLRNGYQDFTIFYGAAKMVRDGQSGRLYDLPTQYAVQNFFAPNVAIRRAALPYNHPPFEALLFVPFLYLGYLPAYSSWTLLNLLMVFWSLRMTRKIYPDVRALSLVFVILAAGAFVPIVNAVIQGQDSILLMFLLTVTLTSLEEGRDVIGGAALAAGLFKFHIVLPLTAILAIRRPRLLLGFCPVALALVSISAAMVGWRGLTHYVWFLFHLEKTGAGGAITASSMPNLRGLAATFLPLQQADNSLMWVTILASMVATGFAMWQAVRKDASICFVFSVACVTAVMVSYHTLAYDLSWLLPILLILFSAPSLTAGENRRQSILLMTVYAVLMGSTKWEWLNPLWCVPVLIWLFWKLPRPLTRLESVAVQSGT